jgi:hypothetical protein
VQRNVFSFFYGFFVSLWHNLIRQVLIIDWWGIALTRTILASNCMSLQLPALSHIIPDIHIMLQGHMHLIVGFSRAQMNKIYGRVRESKLLSVLSLGS